MSQSVAIVGAGLSGLVVARELTAAGRPVTIVDKGRSVGGRLATRRIGDATLDHGAQFFTVRTEAFGQEVEQLMAEGLVYEWCQGFGKPDGYPRYACLGGMNQLAKRIGRDISVAVGTEVRRVSHDGTQWIVTADNFEVNADALVLTAPIPQSLALLDAGDVRFDPVIRARFHQFRYNPTLALMVVLDGPSAVKAPGGEQILEGTFSFVGDNQAKGISQKHSVTLHASSQESEQRWDQDPDQARDELLELARPWLGNAKVVEAQLKRWRYAGPRVPFTDHIAATTVDGSVLVFAGDAFATAKVEGAYTSGRAAAAHLLEDTA
jgi:predicted NAD/FAD-dependent oxidoreductase